MFKKTITFLTLISISFFWVNIVKANETFNVVNWSGKIEITKDNIFVWKVEKHTSIIDLFKVLEINNVDVTDEIINAIDVRYVTPENVDYKVTSDTDIIDNWSIVYVLFKTKENEWFLLDWVNEVSFTLKNLLLNEIWLISELEENSYNKIFEIVYDEEDINIIPIEDTTTTFEEPVLDNVILETNETWIYKNITLMIISILWLIFLIALPKIRNNNI